MLTCEDHRSAIVIFEGRDCPVCRELAEKASEIENANKEIERLEQEVEAQADT